MDFISEIQFRTSRSGGKGGQNVNKVETAVEALWRVEASQCFDDDEKNRILQKLASRINKEGFLVVGSTTDRTQLGNKNLAIQRMKLLVDNALVVEKKRIKTKIPAAVRQKIIANKLHNALKKQNRKKTDWKNV